jgi:DNA-binding NtrC family response regulator
MKILILEDNLKALKAVMEVLEEIGLNDLAVTVFSETRQAENFLKDNFDFDLIFLDYYAIDGNFHRAVFNSLILPEKIIAISSVERYNLETKKRGVLSSVQKNLSNLDKFKEELREEIIKVTKNNN